MNTKMRLHDFNKEQKKMLIEALNEYYINEGWDSIDELPEDGIIPLGYTTYDLDDNREHDIEIKLDLNRICYLNYIDDELVLKEDIESLDEIIHNLESCDLMSMIWNCLDEGRRMYGGYRYE